MMKALVVAALLCAVAAKELSREALSVDQMGTTQLLEMKEDLSSKLESGEEASADEKKFYLYFKQMIINTSLKNINEAFAADQATLTSAWNATVKCDTDLKRQRTDGWKQHSKTVNDNHGDWKECKNTTPPTPPKSCDDCDDLIDGLRPPGTHLPSDRVPVFHDWESIEKKLAKKEPVFFGDKNTYTKLKNWYDEYNQWHCSEEECSSTKTVTTHHQCIKACSEECSTDTTNLNQHNEECDGKQSTFEVSVCAFNSAVEHNCDAWKKCRNKHDDEYKQEKNRTADAEARRKIEYKIMKTIICYIDLMVEHVKITPEQKTGCEKEWDTSALDIVYHDKDTAWPGKLDCKCDVLPAANFCPPGVSHAAWGDHERTPCSEDFTGKWYFEFEYNKDICAGNVCQDCPAGFGRHYGHGLRECLPCMNTKAGGVECDDEFTNQGVTESGCPLCLLA